VTTQRVLDNMVASLRRSPRHAVIVMLWPRCQDQVAKVEGMRLHRATKRYHIFELPTPDTKDPAIAP
jgi:hypothetical protein